MKALKDKRILVVSSEVVPYMPQSEKAVNSFESSKKINDNGGLTRIFMPKYGLINERRHQLHEVIRLSGMNMVINITYAFFDTFGIIDTTTIGAPGSETKTLVYKAYIDGFKGLDLGSAGAQSIMMMLIVLVITIFQFRYIEGKIHYN